MAVSQLDSLHILVMLFTDNIHRWFIPVFLCHPPRMGACLLRDPSPLVASLVTLKKRHAHTHPTRELDFLQQRPLRSPQPVLDDSSSSSTRAGSEVPKLPIMVRPEWSWNPRQRETNHVGVIVVRQTHLGWGGGQEHAGTSTFMFSC